MCSSSVVGQAAQVVVRNKEKMHSISSQTALSPSNIFMVTVVEEDGNGNSNLMDVNLFLPRPAHVERRKKVLRRYHNHVRHDNGLSAITAPCIE